MHGVGRCGEFVGRSADARAGQGRGCHWRQGLGRCRQRHRVIQGHPLRRAACWSAALEGAAASAVVDRCEAGIGVPSELHAGRELREDLRRHGTHPRGLPVSECVDSGEDCGRQTAGDGMDLRRGFCRRYDEYPRVRRHTPRREGRRPRQRRIPPGRLRLSRTSRAQ